MRTSSAVARTAAVMAVLVAVYEALAIFTDSFPTVTELLEWNEWVEVVVVGGLMLWLAQHFGWVGRLMELIESEERRGR